MQPVLALDRVEGPSAARIDGRYYNYIFFDRYRAPRYSGAVKSNDLSHWLDISSQRSSPRGTRPGTARRLSEALIHPLESLPDNQTKSN